MSILEGPFSNPKALQDAAVFANDMIARMLDGRIGGSLPFVLTYGVTWEEAGRFGLPCGGTLELVVEPEAVLRGLCDRLGVELHPEMLRPHADRAVRRRRRGGGEPDGVSPGVPREARGPPVPAGDADVPVAGPRGPVAAAQQVVRRVRRADRQGDARRRRDSPRSPRVRSSESTSESTSSHAPTRAVRTRWSRRRTRRPSPARRPQRPVPPGIAVGRRDVAARRPAAPGPRRTCASR